MLSDGPANRLWLEMLFFLLQLARVLISFRVTNIAGECLKRLCIRWRWRDPLNKSGVKKVARRARRLVPVNRGDYVNRLCRTRGALDCSCVERAWHTCCLRVRRRPNHARQRATTDASG